MPFDDLSDLSVWMAEAGIDELELIGPSFRLRLDSGGVHAHDDLAGDRQGDTISGQILSSDVIAASTVGIFLHRHPLHEAALAPEGTAVRAGQALGLLRIGPLLVPVNAPRDGIVGATLVAHETAVGFGTGLVELHPASTS
ncbi:acetyl-CoA carboxylase biotin carboxyl carrier protein [Bradyrhizobium sp. LM2.7]